MSQEDCMIAVRQLSIKIGTKVLGVRARLILSRDSKKRKRWVLLTVFSRLHFFGKILTS